VSDRPVPPALLDKESRQKQDFCRIVRLGAVLAIVYVILGVTLEIVQAQPFSTWPGIVFGVAVAGSLILFSFFSQRVQDVSRLAYLVFSAQALFITASIHFFGGIHSPLPAIYIINVMAAAYVLETKGGLWVSAVSLLSLALIWMLEYLGLLPLTPSWVGVEIGKRGWFLLADMVAYAMPMVIAAVVGGAIKDQLGKHHRAVNEYRRQADRQLAELRRAQLQTKMESGRLEAILHSTHEGMMLYDPGGQLVLANPIVGELLTAPGSSPNFDYEGSTASGSLTSTLRQELEQAARDPTAVTHRVLTLEGSRTRYVAVNSFPVSGRDEQIMGRLFVLRDITDQKELEMTRDEWTRMLVHDLRSPLISIMGNLEVTEELMLEHEDLPAAGKGLRMAQKSAQDLLDMVSSLLDISKLEAGKVALEHVPISLPHLAAGALRKLSPMAQSAQVHLRLDAPHDLPMVTGDRETLYRVLVNLLDNAIKFTPDGGSVAVQIEQVEGEMRISVTDDGAGIPEEQRHTIFDRFSQVSGASGRRAGTGLGLTFCKLVVEAHDGRIWIEDPPGGGSKFVFTLPHIIDELGE